LCVDDVYKVSKSHNAVLVIVHSIKAYGAAFIVLNVEANRRLFGFATGRQ
jgi:hypothetical protein